MIEAYNKDLDDFLTLGEGNAKEFALGLIARMDECKSIDFSENPNPKFSTNYLWGDARGMMFGVLECEDRKGDIIFLKAFSSQYNSEWHLEGWVDPLLDTKEFYRIVPPVDKKIKNIGKALQDLQKGSDEYKALASQRKKLSQQLMDEIFDLYYLHNFCDERKSLKEAFAENRGIPTGTGECCAPKLLNSAAIRGLKPLGLVEFYYGRENRSGSRIHGQFYDPCKEKCGPILGFLLRGTE